MLGKGKKQDGVTAVQRTRPLTSEGAETRAPILRDWTSLRAESPGRVGGASVTQLGRASWNTRRVGAGACLRPDRRTPGGREAKNTGPILLKNQSLQKCWP